MSIFMMADLRHLEFYGSNNGFFEKTIYTISCMSLINIIALNCLVFEKISFYCTRFYDGQATDGQTVKQMDRPNAFSRLRYRERRLNKP